MRIGRLPFIRNEGGNVAVLFGLMLLPLVLFAGVGIDTMQAVDLRQQLQVAADAAALAGATAYGPKTTSAAAQTIASNYVSNAATRFNANSNFASSVSCSTKSAGGATIYTCTVSLSASQATSLMALVTDAVPVSVTATAQNPIYNVTFSLSGFSSEAYDYNAIYWYIVPEDGGLPSPSKMTLLYCNNNSGSVNYNKTIDYCGNSQPSPPQVTAGQKLGFALKNITGGLKGYGSNGYGGAQGSTHWFYSHLSPPSGKAYPSVTKDCSVQAIQSGSSTSLTSGSCLSSLPINASLSCGANSGKTTSYYWNDMGGGSDDYDYNDASFNVSCTAGSSSYNTGVVLTQ